MDAYTVRQPAELVGGTVRTLHHYDRIELLRPRIRSTAGYHLYGKAKLLRLQQVLFYRKLGVPLSEIRSAFDASDFDPMAALRQHRPTSGRSSARPAVYLRR